MASQGLGQTASMDAAADALVSLKDNGPGSAAPQAGARPSPAGTPGTVQVRGHVSCPFPRKEGAQKTQNLLYPSRYERGRWPP